MVLFYINVFSDHSQSLTHMHSSLANALQADERAVLKHFKWPERKADALQEAAVEYRELKKLEKELSSYSDDPSIHYGVALKKMANLLDKYKTSPLTLILTELSLDS